MRTIERMVDAFVMSHDQTTFYQRGSIRRAVDFGRRVESEARNRSREAVLRKVGLKPRRPTDFQKD